MSRVLITTSSFDLANNPAIDRLRAAGIEIVFNPHGRRLTEEEAGVLLRSGFIGMIAGVELLTRSVLEGASGLKVISRAGIGLDSVDLAAASDLGMRVFSTPGAPVSAVAELTIGLILNLLRNIVQADRKVRDGGWQQLMGNLLGAQTVGLIGFGRIGRRVAELASSFGSRVVATDPAICSVDSSEVELLPLEELLRRADVVSLHLPYAETRHHLIGERELALMKPTAILINTARGGLIDEAALERALKTGALAAAGIDTYEREPYDGPLANLPQTLLTAHMGSYAKESRIQMEREAAENLLRGLTECGAI